MASLDDLMKKAKQVKANSQPSVNEIAGTPSNNKAYEYFKQECKGSLNTPERQNPSNNDANVEKVINKMKTLFSVFRKTLGKGDC